MNAASSYRDAVLDDSRYLLGQVVTLLYQGGRLRPDIYLEQISYLPRINYNGCFNAEQRRRMHESGKSHNYDIVSGVRHFDVSLLVLLAEHTCNLTMEDNLLKSLADLRNLRNKVCHPPEINSSFDVNEDNLIIKFEELLILYTSIINSLETKIGYSMYPLRLQIKERVFQRIRASPSNASDSVEMPSWGKVALGVTAGVAALGIVGALVWQFSKKGESEGLSERLSKELSEGLSEKKYVVTMGTWWWDDAWQDFK